MRQPCQRLLRIRDCMRQDVLRRRKYLHQYCSGA
jgi:hypothetical protein